MDRRLISIGFALACALPTTAMATGWGGKGAAEPSTLHDKTDGWMFQDPPEAGQVRRAQIAL